MEKSDLIKILTSSEEDGSTQNFSFKTFFQNLIPQKNKKVISFSVYGDKPIYLIGAEKNIDAASKIYPDWICRFYCHKDISNLEKLKHLSFQNKCEIVVVDSPIPPMYWRYFAADDPSVSSVIFRDTDSVVNSREKAAVDEWQESDKVLHTMHDHSGGHWSPVMGGMCGIKTPIMNFDMHKEIDDWSKSLRNYSFSYSDDQSFLSKKLLPLFVNSCIDHHNDVANSKYSYSVPFPEHEDISYGHFVGDRVSAFTLTKDIYKSIDSNKVFLVPHLGPTDHFTVKDAIFRATELFEEVVLPCKTPSFEIVNYMFGGYDNVKIVNASNDDEIFIIYQDQYSKSHKFLGFGIHGDRFPDLTWGSELAFKQLNQPFQENIFITKSNNEISYENLPKNIASQISSLPKPDFKNKVSASIDSSSKNIPKVSVIIPTFNRFKYLLNALTSIKNQTYKNFEVIIVNDNSTEQEYYNYDFKSHYGENFHILHLPKNSRSLYGKVAGGGHARNIAMMLSDADYITFLDDDDQFLPNKLETQVNHLKNSDCKMSCTEALFGSGPMTPEKSYKNWHYDGVYWDSIKNIFSKSGKSEDFDRMFKHDLNIWTEQDFLTHNCCVCSTVMIDRSVLQDAGYFPLKPFAEDWAYWKSIVKHTNCLYIREPLSYMDSSHGDGQHWI